MNFFRIKQRFATGVTPKVVAPKHPTTAAKLASTSGSGLTVCLILGLTAACTRASESTFAIPVSSQANLSALGTSLKDLQGQWQADQHEGVGWPLVEMSLENAVVPFQHSTQRLTLDLLLNAPGAPADLGFARGLSAEYKSKAVAILGLASQVGMENWGREFFDSILQKHPSLDRLSSYQNSLVNALSFTAEEQRRLGTSNRGGVEAQVATRHDEALIELLNRALEEKWDVEQFEDLEIILGVARLEHPCGKLPTRSLMVRCLGSARFSRLEDGFFGAPYGRRYQELAKEAIATLVESDTSEENKLAIGDAFFPATGLLWSHCEADQFTIKQALLRGSFRATAGELDDIRKSVMEHQIHDILRDCKTADTTPVQNMPAKFSVQSVPHVALKLSHRAQTLDAQPSSLIR